MNIFYCLFFVAYFFSTLNQFESKLGHIKVTHKKDAKIYTVEGKKFKTFRNAHRYNKKRRKLSKKKPIRKPIKRLTRKNTRRQINRIIKRKPINKSNRFQPRFQSLLSKHQLTQSLGLKPQPTQTLVSKPQSTQPLVSKPQSTQLPIITTTTTKVDEIAERIKAFYNDINEHRKKHKANPLKVNEELVKRIEESLKDKSKWGILVPKVVRNSAGFGNILANPVDFWYSRKDNYDYDKPTYEDTSKEFIHMIWKSATDIGCGMIHAENYFVFCDFSPVEKFNDPEEIKKNVLKP